MSDVVGRIERLRTLRIKPERNLSIAGLVRTTAEHASRSQKKLGYLIELWEELLPADLAARTTITALRGGIVHVTVDSSATAYELDRLLREGLLRELRARYRGTLVRVKVKQCHES